MKHLLFAGLLFSILNCNGQSASGNSHYAQEATIVDFPKLKNILEKEKDKFLIVNFWATWCAPCVEELPAFIEIDEKYKKFSNYKMILISLDRARNIRFLNNFLNKKSITTEVYLLDDIKNMNTWIPAIDSSWSGTIPATVFYKNGKKILFREEQMNETELETIVKENL
ncbi:MAG: TlpA family protein disulfide reductase [Flavobacteriaceae bacterium]|jgi:thiol-disulfide isomerase/thioredoxin|nr:TlpA family protein disulfide reductase [Flavobacteriaceae bacterium]